MSFLKFRRGSCDSSTNSLLFQYYDGLTGDIYTVPISDQHNFWLSKYAALTGTCQIVVDSYDHLQDRCPAAKILLFTEDADKLIEHSRAEGLHEHYHIIKGSPDPFFVEFLRPGVCKGNSVAKLCEYMKIDRNNIVAFGDGDNDREMLQYAGIGIAMSNAKDVLKEVANLVLEVSLSNFPILCLV